MTTTTSVKVTKNPIPAVVSSLFPCGKTAKVEVSRLVVSNNYGKRQTRKTILLVSLPSRAVKVGETVTIESSRRISKFKSWRICDI